MGLWNGVKRAASAMANQPAPTGYFAGGKRVQCNHCGGGEFHEAAAQLNTAGMTFLGLDWANPTATTLTCSGCSKIHWFAARLDRQ